MLREIIQRTAVVCYNHTILLWIRSQFLFLLPTNFHNQKMAEVSLRACTAQLRICSYVDLNRSPNHHLYNFSMNKVMHKLINHVGSEFNTISCRAHGGTSSDAEMPWNELWTSAVAQICASRNDEFGSPIYSRWKSMLKVSRTKVNTENKKSGKNKIVYANNFHPISVTLLVFCTTSTDMPATTKDTLLVHLVRLGQLQYLPYLMARACRRTSNNFRHFN